MSATPQIKPIGPGLYAYISDNDSSANSTFLVGNSGILVVGTGFDATEGGKLLQAIRGVSGLPVLFIVNTHYHRDHQGGNFVVGPSSVVISTDWTRERTLAMIHSSPSPERSLLQPADVTFQEKLTIHLEPYSAEIYFLGKAHTSGDALVYFPNVGSVENWIRALDQVLAKPVDNVVPGHFELATKVELQRFRDYLSDLFKQVQALYEKGANLEQIRRDIRTEKYSDFRQYPQFHATFSDNAEVIYQQLQKH